MIGFSAFGHVSRNRQFEIPGNAFQIEVITALNEDAYANPEIPIGRIGSLNFDSGILTVLYENGAAAFFESPKTERAAAFLQGVLH